MKANDKIYVSEYLKQLNDQVKKAIDYQYVKPDYVEMLTCKELAERCEVTQATISNLTTSSKFSLLFRISEEILDAYYAFFIWSESRAREENPDEFVTPRDKFYVLSTLTCYFTDSWLNMV